MSYDGVPGLVETTGGHGETTLVIDAARIVEASTYLRDELGFNFLSDLSPTDYLGWGARGVSGYIGTPAGRDLHGPGTQGLARVPDAKPKRFAVNYHALRLSDEPVRVRLQAWLDDGEEIDSVDPRLADRGLVRARGVGHVRHRLPRPPESRQDPDGGRLGGPPAAEGLPDRRRAGAVLGGGVTRCR